LLFLLCVAGCSVAKPTPQATPNVPFAQDTPFDDYKTWTRMFASPRNASFQLMALCRTMTDAEQAYVSSEHAEYFVQVYVNPKGADAMKQTGARTFPEGTVIVKEKWAQDPRIPNMPAEAAGLGVMVKRAAGFDDAGGNWEYWYVDKTGFVVNDQKQMQDCRACHMKISDRDAVYYPAVLNE
jgi:hypothetical protein